MLMPNLASIKPLILKLGRAMHITHSIAFRACVLPFVLIFISHLGMKSWDLQVCDRASTITHVDREKKNSAY